MNQPTDLDTLPSIEDLEFIDKKISELLGNKRSIVGFSNGIPIVISRSFATKYCMHVGGQNVIVNHEFTQVGGDVLNINPEDISYYRKKQGKTESGDGGYDIAKILEQFIPLEEEKIKQTIPIWSHQKLMDESTKSWDIYKKPNSGIGNKNGSIENWDYLISASKVANLKNRWDSANPKTVIDSIISEVPDIKPITSEEAGKLKIPPSNFELFLISKLKNFRPSWKTDNQNPGSLGALESMICMRDQVRTKKFLQSISASIKNLEEDGINPINMCDAGCGAVPILAIYGCLCSPKIQCTCIELNSDSAKIAGEIVESFGLSGRITVKQTDATSYHHNGKFDLLVSETMHSGLTAEPIVQILGNLSQQVSDNAEIIPKKITVKASLMKPIDFFGSNKGVIKIYSDQHVHQYLDNPIPTQFVFDTSKQGQDNIDFKLAAPDDGEYIILLSSDVDLGNETIHEYESLITMPQSLMDPGGKIRIYSLKKGEIVNVRYKAGSNLSDIDVYRSSELI